MLQVAAWPLQGARPVQSHVWIRPVVRHSEGNGVSDRFDRPIWFDACLANQICSSTHLGQVHLKLGEVEQYCVGGVRLTLENP